MSERITMAQLESWVEAINRASGTPQTAWTKKPNGQYVANIGNYHLDGAYGGWQLVQHMNEGGGIHVISTGGFVSKRELYNQLRAFHSGIGAGLAAKKKKGNRHE